MTKTNKSETKAWQLSHPSLCAEKPAKIPWRMLVPTVLISAVVLLVGLPLGAVWIVNNSGCCFANAPENVVTFWAALTAGFLALFGMLVTGVFIITTFRIDATARNEARLAAGDELRRYLETYKKKLSGDLKKLQAHVVKLAKDGKDAEDAIAIARQEVEDKRKDVTEAMKRTQQQVEDWRDDADSAIATARQSVVSAAEAAQEAIDAVQRDVERRGDEAVRAAESAKKEVDAAITALQATQQRLDQATDRRPRPEGDPEGTDE